MNECAEIEAGFVLARLVVGKNSVRRLVGERTSMLPDRAWRARRAPSHDGIAARGLRAIAGSIAAALLGSRRAPGMEASLTVLEEGVASSSLATWLCGSRCDCTRSATYRRILVTAAWVRRRLWLEASLPRFHLRTSH
jgi:hypothetical protein